MADRMSGRLFDSPGAATLSRRQMVAWSALGVGALGISRAVRASEGPNLESAILTVKAIHHEVPFRAGPQRVYGALVDARQFTAFSGGRAASIEVEAGGAFSLFAGHIVGRNLELMPARRLVQAWRVVDWPEGVYSIARFELQARGAGTLLIFDHTGFPSALAEHLESGWRENYWDALHRYVDTPTVQE